MTHLTLDTLSRILGRHPDPDNAGAILAGLRAYGQAAGLTAPHRLAQFLAQVIHESGGFRHDRELWGPTPAQARYDFRTDLGNTPEADGDGFLFRGRAGIQVTGRSNYRRFRDWCRAAGLMAPDFETRPEAVLSDPWEGLAPIWYWQANGLSRYADAGDTEMITRRINGGLNGYRDRLNWYARAALVLLGDGPDDLRAFQARSGLAVDGIAGPRSRAALHGALLALSGGAKGPGPNKSAGRTLWPAWLGRLFSLLSKGLRT